MREVRGMHEVAPAREDTPSVGCARHPTLARLGRGDLLPLLALSWIILGCAALVVVEHPQFSPIDELQHYDYVNRLVIDHRIPRLFEAYSVTTDRALACYGPAPWKMPLPPCDSSPERLRTWGKLYTTAGGYPPVYYAGTAVGAVAVRPVSGNLFLAARLASSLWLVLGAVAMYLLCRTARAGRLLAFSLALGAALAPAMLFQGSTVNPDSTQMLAGAGAVLAWLRLRGRPGWRCLLGLTLVLAAAPMVKSNLFPVPFAVLAAELTLIALDGGPRCLFRLSTWSLRRPTGRLLLAVAVAAGIAAAWSAMFMVLTEPDNNVTRSALDGNSPWSTVTAIRTITRSVTPLTQNLTYMPPLNGALAGQLATLFGWMALVGAVAGSLLGRERDADGVEADLGGGTVVDPARAISLAAVWSLLLASPMTYLIVAAAGRFFPYPARYSLWTLPLGIAALAGLVGRRSGLVVAALGLGVAVTTIVELVLELP
jgi:hypothetical protein